MKHNWEYKKLGEVCDIKTGKLDANAASPNGEYPFFTCSKETLRIDNYSYDEECVLIAGNGDLNVKYYNGKFDAYQRTYIITLKDIPMPISMTYLYMFFSKYIEHLRQICIGGVIKYIKLNNLTDTLIPLPPLSVQERIVEELDGLSLILEKKKQQIKELDSLAQSIFYDMFGDPIENEKGWEVKKLGEVGEIVTGSTPSTTDNTNWNGKINWVTPAELSNQLFYGATQRSLTEKGAKNLTLMPVGTVLLSSRAPIGKIAITTQPMCCNQGFKNIICGEYLNNIFLYYYLLITLENIKALGCGATFKEVSKKAIYSYETILPPLDLQQSFAKKIEAIEKQKELINQSIKEVQLLFDAKMDYYFGD